MQANSSQPRVPKLGQPLHSQTCFSGTVVLQPSYIQRIRSLPAPLTLPSMFLIYGPGSQFPMDQVLGDSEGGTFSSEPKPTFPNFWKAPFP